MALAPIALFVYNRPKHTRKVLESLKANKLAADSTLYIFADGRRERASVEERSNILSVRALIKEEQWCGRVEIIESDKNKGLANSIIGGVTKLINEYGKIIVLEDDLLLHKDFLSYMNDALDRYENEPKVFTVTGYQYPLDLPLKVPETFFMRIAASWTWGTWKRAWDNFDPAATGWEEMKHNLEMRRQFNFDNSIDFYAMMVAQMETKQVDSWSIRWDWTIFKLGGLNLYPYKTLVENIGFDGSGVHKEHNDINYSPMLKGPFKPEFPAKVELNVTANKYLINFWKLHNRHDMLTRLRRRLKRLFS